MRRTRLLVPALVLASSGALAAHDLFLKLSEYFVRPDAPVRITALNGTFTTSENAIARARVADLSLAGPGGRQPVDTARLAAEGTRTAIRTRTGSAGTYVLGLSLRPSEITLKGEQFNEYLREEGLLTTLAARRAAGELARPSTERYAKHVKVIFQAGAAHSESYATVFGYPVEIVPLTNPYELKAGDTLSLRLLKNGAPAAGIAALAGGRNTAGSAIPTAALLADHDGVVRVWLRAPGTWYVKFISMTRVSEPKLDYISQWATLTFAVRR